MSRRLLSLIVPWTFILAFTLGSATWFFLMPANALSAADNRARIALATREFITTPDGHTLIGVVQDPLANIPPPPPLPKIVALTFDDGPHGTHTPELLDILERKHVPATFFLLGEQVEQYPEIAARMVAQGHQLGNHTWDHAHVVRMDTKEIAADLERTSAAIAAATGIEPTVTRPPFGTITDELQLASTTPLILWSIDPKDWRDREATTITDRVLKDIRPGAIILLHDIYGSSVEAVEPIIDQLQAQGYTFVTIDRLFEFDTHPELRVAGVPHYLQTFGRKY
jgi:peptidoglycan/xylan/chitin deacetylase (PgdA/CDA1 family)